MKRRLHSAFLASAVFFSALLGVGAHEHTASTLQFATACLVDHAHEIEGDHPRSLHVEAADNGHHHGCIGCHASRHRHEAVTAGVLALDPEPAAWSAPAVVSRSEQLRAVGPGARGPPLARSI